MSTSATNARDALGSLDRVRQHAANGDYTDAWADWVDACSSMDSAKKLEPTGPGSEYQRALDEAADVLHKCGKEMREALAKGEDREAYERQTKHLRSMISDIQAAVARETADEAGAKG